MSWSKPVLATQRPLLLGFWTASLSAIVELIFDKPFGAPQDLQPGLASDELGDCMLLPPSREQVKLQITSKPICLAAGWNHQAISLSRKKLEGVQQSRHWGTFFPNAHRAPTTLINSKKWSADCKRQP